MVSHCYSRGSLHSLVGRNAPSSPEDEAWAKQVLAAYMGPQDAVYATNDCYYLDENGYYYEDDNVMDEISEISKLWGIYRRPEPVFNEEFFSPKGR